MVTDILSPALITDNLITRFIGQKVFLYPRLTSTMDIARQKAHQRTPEGTVVIADELESSASGYHPEVVLLYPLFFTQT